MADYYPILARAVSRLATNNVNRQELYEHARAILHCTLGQKRPKKPLTKVYKRMECI